MSDRSTAVPAQSTATTAYARIYEEQQQRLVAYARSLTRNAWTAEDLVAEAHFRVWRRLAAGHEIDNIPAYLRTTVRHLAIASGTAVRETPQDPQAEDRAEPGAHGGDPAERVSSVDLVVRVLGQLPERWVKALWLAEAEGQPLAAIGPQLGTKEGATAVLLHRAREGMRQAFLRAQTGAPDDPACQVHWARMPAYVRGAATERQGERLLGHVDACDDCRARLAALMRTNDRLPAIVGPALLVLAVGGTGKYLLAGAASGTGAGLLHGVRQAAVGGAKAPVVAAGAVVAGAAAVCLVVLGPADSFPVPAQRTPVADVPALRTPVARATPTRAPARAEAADDHDTSVQAAEAPLVPARRTGSPVAPAVAPSAAAPTTPAAEPTPDTPSPVESVPVEETPPTDTGTPDPEPSVSTAESPDPATPSATPSATASAPTEDPGDDDCAPRRRSPGHHHGDGGHHH